MIEELQEFTPEKMQYLRLLAQQFPSEQAVCTEIINLTAIQNLPKGTEHFMSDIHGESEAFADIKKAITENADIASATDFFEPVTTRVMVQESDEGTKISGQISDLKQLLQMYRYGAIRERE